MTANIDFYQTANELIKQHGEDAPTCSRHGPRSRFLIEFWSGIRCHHGVKTKDVSVEEFGVAF